MSPPKLPSPLYSCGPSTTYNVLVDKGTLDAACFDTSERLIAYLATVRRCLLAPVVDSASVPPLYVHFSDDPPEVRGELLAAAFPVDEEQRWRVSSAVVNDPDDDEHCDGAWTYYRYSVYHASCHARAC